MTAKYMLDTNICIYLMKHQAPRVSARFADCFVGDVVISAITLAELEFGVACSGDSWDRNQAALDSFFRDPSKKGVRESVACERALVSGTTPPD